MVPIQPVDESEDPSLEWKGVTPFGSLKRGYPFDSLMGFALYLFLHATQGLAKPLQRVKGREDLGAILQRHAGPAAIRGLVGLLTFHFYGPQSACFARVPSPRARGRYP